MIKEGIKAPNFKLKDQNGKIISLKDYEGKNIVLYFYPKDDTSGCTAEACNFRDEFPKFGNVNAVRGAKTFYENAFDKPIIYAFHDALKAIDRSSDRNIYVFWGLHFSTLEKAKDINEGRQRTFNELVRSLFAWGKKIRTTKSTEVKKNSLEIFKRVYKEIEGGDFDLKNANVLAEKMREAMKNMPQARDEINQSQEDTQSRNSIQRPTEYIKSKK